MMVSSTATLARVEAALSAHGASAKQIHERIGIGARASVREALVELCRQRRARVEGFNYYRVYFACNPEKGST